MQQQDQQQAKEQVFTSDEVREKTERTIRILTEMANTGGGPLHLTHPRPKPEPTPEAARFKIQHYGGAKRPFVVWDTWKHREVTRFGTLEVARTKYPRAMVSTAAAEAGRMG